MQPKKGNNANRHGLTRDIPRKIKLEVRKKCGFGCVICGFGIVEYEHVDPPFKDAIYHDVDCIVLLCPSCHRKVTTGMLSKDLVKSSQNHPKCIRDGFVQDYFKLSNGFPIIKIGGSLLKNCPTPIQIFDKPIFSIKPGEVSGEPFSLSAFFTDSKNNQSLTIENNEWKALSTNWDVEVVGCSVTIRERRNKIHLSFTVSQPNTFAITKLHMTYHGTTLTANEDYLKIESNGGEATLYNCMADNCSIGFQFET